MVVGVFFADERDSYPHFPVISAGFPDGKGFEKEGENRRNGIKTGSTRACVC